MEKKNSIVDFLKTPGGKVVLTVGLYVVIFGVEYFLLTVFGTTPAIFVVLALVMAYFGWKALNKITPDLFLIMPLSSWLWYWVVKGLLSLFVGAFIAPYQIAKMIIAKI